MRLDPRTEENAFRYFAEATTVQEAQAKLASALPQMPGMPAAGGAPGAPQMPMQLNSGQQQSPVGMTMPKLGNFSLPVVESLGQSQVGVRSGVSSSAQQTSSPVGMTSGSRKSAASPAAPTPPANAGMSDLKRHALMGLGGAGIGAGVGALSRYMRGPDDENEPLKLTDYLTPAAHGAALGGAAGLGASALQPYAMDAYKAVTNDKDPPGFGEMVGGLQKRLKDSKILPENYGDAVSRMRSMQSNAESVLGLSPSSWLNGESSPMGSTESTARGWNAAASGATAVGLAGRDVVKSLETGELGQFRDPKLLQQGARNLADKKPEQLARMLGVPPNDPNFGSSPDEIADNLTRSATSGERLKKLDHAAQNSLTGYAIDPKGMGEAGPKPAYRPSMTGAHGRNYVPAGSRRGIAGTVGKALAPLGLGWLSDMGLHNAFAPDPEEIQRDAIRRTLEMQRQQQSLPQLPPQTTTFANPGSR